MSPDEFYWQESHYDHDSRRGRELLFLMANYEWVRATSEIIDVMRSDTIETTIKIDVDLTQITHEAFRKRTDRLWLPIAILPPETGQHHSEPDLFAAVTDAAGNPMPMLQPPTCGTSYQRPWPKSSPRWRFRTPCPARWSANQTPQTPINGARATCRGGSAVETRDERLLLSAAIYRLLRYEPSRNINAARYRRVVDPTQDQEGHEDSLLPLLDYYVALVGRQRTAVHGRGDRPEEGGTGTAVQSRNSPGGRSR